MINSIPGLPFNLLNGQPERLPDNLSAQTFELTNDSYEDAPYIFELPLYGSVLKGAGVFSTHASMYVKISDGQNFLYPVSGFWRIPAYLNNWIPLERALIGPPWKLVIYAYCANPGNYLSVYAVAGDRRETDTDYQILQVLQEINRKIKG